MEFTRNSQIKEYTRNLFCEEDKELKDVREHSCAAALPPIAVPANVGKMLYFFCRLQQPKRVLEIGTLGGYSTLWLARGMPAEGVLLTLESEEKHCHIARENIFHANLEAQIEVRLGEAEMLLQKMIEEKEPSFDLVFIDADKKRYGAYLELVFALSHPGTLVLLDNLIPKRGVILSPDMRDVEAVSIYAFNEQLARDRRFESVLFPTIVGDGRVDALGALRVR